MHYGNIRKAAVSLSLTDPLLWAVQGKASPEHMRYTPEVSDTLSPYRPGHLAADLSIKEEHPTAGVAELVRCLAITHDPQHCIHQVWWYMTAIPPLGRWRQEHRKFKVILAVQ